MTPPRSWRTWLPGLALLGTALFVACGGGGDDEAEAATPNPTATGTPATDTPAAGITAADTPTAEPTPADSELTAAEVRTAQTLERFFPKLDLTKRAVSLTEIVSVLAPDSIPAIDSPQFVTPEDAEAYLSPEDPVISLVVNGDARAYPLQIMTWHEIANDVVGGEPVIVTYCPLCNSAIVFSRVVDGEERTFGVSGSLRQTDLIMFDRQTETLWQQFTGEAIVGEGVGTRLEFLPAQLVSFAEFQAAFPDGQVLSQETGFARPYGDNPYPLYDTRTSTLFTIDEFDDSQISAKERVLTLEIKGETAAFPFSALSELVVIEATVGGEPVVAFWQPGQVSALDEVFIIGSRNVGSAGAFSPFLDGERLRFEQRDGAIVDAGTGSTWDVLGRAVEGPLAGAQLEPLISGNHFWFAWAVFQPETRVIVQSDAGGS